MRISLKPILHHHFYSAVHCRHPIFLFLNFFLIWVVILPGNRNRNLIPVRKWSHRRWQIWIRNFLFVFNIETFSVDQTTKIIIILKRPLASLDINRILNATSFLFSIFPSSQIHFQNYMRSQILSFQTVSSLFLRSVQGRDGTKNWSESCKPIHSDYWSLIDLCYFDLKSQNKS